jgi:hypothetical protein
MEEHKVRVFENGMMRKIFGLKGGDNRITERTA